MREQRPMTTPQGAEEESHEASKRPRPHGVSDCLS